MITGTCSSLTMCGDLKICVKAETTHIQVMLGIFPSANIIHLTGEEFKQGFIDGKCNVMAGEQSDISEPSVRSDGYNGDFAHGERVRSKEPLGESSL